MECRISAIHYAIGIALLISCLVISIKFSSRQLSFGTLYSKINFSFFEWDSSVNQSARTHQYSNHAYIRTLIWTHDGTGIMKYVQWMITRKLANLKIIRLNSNCDIAQENYFVANSTDDMFIQIFILSLSFNFKNQSKCSKKVDSFLTMSMGKLDQIYFTRNSTRATVLFHWLDSMRENSGLNFTWNSSIEDAIKTADHTQRYILSHFTSKSFIKWKVVYSEDLIKTNLIDCEKSLTDFLSLLGVNTSSQKVRAIIEYDSHQFIDDATWWDQSRVAERVLNKSTLSIEMNLSYSEDFYHLHGDRSFNRYLFDNRKCFSHGIFPQLPSETEIHHTSTNQSNRCSWKPFDCAFSDLYSFADREQFYNETDYKPIKCAFTIPSIFDKVRDRYGRNHTCQIIVFTCVTNCYDPLPVVNGIHSLPVCLVALLDTKTINAYKRIYSINSSFQWDLVDLGHNATPFSFVAKTTETLKIVGQRMFPLAKWIAWLDGKGQINDLVGLLREARAPVIGAPHPDGSRTSASEVGPTIYRVRLRKLESPIIHSESITDIVLQEKEYKQEGFYVRSDQLKLKMYDIAVFMYRNNHPCTFRYLCGWHNEVNYYSYRGQLSVYYSAVRMNLTQHLHFMPRKFYSTRGHRRVC